MMLTPNIYLTVQSVTVTGGNSRVREAVKVLSLECKTHAVSANAHLTT